MAEEKKKSWFRRHWIITIILIIFIIGGIGSILFPEEQSDNPKTETKTTFAIGDKISIDNVDYTVNEAFNLPIVGSSYVNKEADGTFVIISIEVKNNKNNEILLTSNDFKLKDSQSRVYNADSSAGLYLDTMGYKSFMFKQLGAGLSTNGEVVFDVPKDAKGLVLEISGESILSDSKYVSIGDVSNL